jgi:hypothetical protein
MGAASRGDEDTPALLDGDVRDVSSIDVCLEKPDTPLLLGDVTGARIG